MINKRFEQKRLFKIAKIRTKKFQQFLIRNEIYEIKTKIDNFRFVNRRRLRNVTKINQNFNNEIFALKKSKFYQLRFNTITKYFKKIFKKFRKWHKNVKKKFETNSKYFFIFYDKIVYAQKNFKNIVKIFWKIRKKKQKKSTN